MIRRRGFGRLLRRMAHPQAVPFGCRGLVMRKTILLLLLAVVASGAKCNPLGAAYIAASPLFDPDPTVKQEPGKGGYN